MIYPEALFDISRTDRKAGGVLLAFLPEWVDDGIYIGVVNNWNGNVEVRGPDFALATFVYISDKMGCIKPFHPTTEELENDNWQTRLVTYPVVDTTVEETIGDALDHVAELEGKLNITPAEALQTLSAAFKADPDYAWGWHCNVSMAAYDQGLSQESADKAAANFMKSAFGVDTSELHKTKDISAEKEEELLDAYNQISQIPSEIFEDNDSTLLPPIHDVE